MVNNEMNSENLNNDSTKVAWKDQESEGNNTELPSNVDSSVPNNKLSDSLKSTIRKSVDFPIYEEESTTEIDDDYDEESCFSTDDHCREPNKRLDRIKAEVAKTTLDWQLSVSLREYPKGEADSLGILPEKKFKSAITSDSEISGQREFPSDSDDIHLPRSLPTFPDPQSCMWTSSHAANCPSEDRSCSLVNVLLCPQLDKESCQNRVLIRLSLWSVIDGHGGGCVATYASEVLLPHIAASVSRALQCTIVHRGYCTVNGELRDANALDLDGLIHSSDRSHANPHSVHYRAPDESLAAVTELDKANPCVTSEDDTVARKSVKHLALRVGPSVLSLDAEASLAPPLLPRSNTEKNSVASSIQDSFKSNASGPVGTHSETEITNVKNALTRSFLAVDEGWINSIDPVASHQTSCQSNGRWNVGACALVVFTLQRLDWTDTSAEKTKTSVGKWDLVGQDTSHNLDAARRRMLDFVAKGKSASSISSLSSASSRLNDDPNTESAIESEITETEDDFETSSVEERQRNTRGCTMVTTLPPPFQHCLINAPGGCNCHSYRAHEAMLYTAHVGDCRAVLLGSAPPRTIEVLPPGGPSFDHPDTTDDESSHHSSDETECLSSSDHDAESSDDEYHSLRNPPYMRYARRQAHRLRRTSRDTGNHAPFFAFPPLRSDSISSEEESDTEIEPVPPIKLYPPRVVRTGSDSEDDGASNETLSSETREMSPPLHLAPFTRPIDLTTDHSAYNPVEVALVRKRCNNAPKAISAGIGGGIKRVAGSLAVTRALGDAYLKTSLLSFDPYRHNCPYITAQPETNCRLLSQEGDTVLVLATDGVWERCNGEDILRWIRNYSAERIAETERKNSRRREGTPSESAHDENICGIPLVGQKRNRRASTVAMLLAKKHKVTCLGVNSSHGSKLDSVSTVADVIVRRVLNKVRKARNMTSLQALMTLPKGRARRSKHDDITASVVALSAFVSPPSHVSQETQM